VSAWVEGTVGRVVYAAPESGYAVIRLVSGEEEVTVVGSFADSIEELEGRFLALEGKWEEHAVHGRQFRASGFLANAPRTIAGLKLYLSASNLPGIGPVLAGRVVDCFGLETPGILSNHAERLAEVDGIGPSRVTAIAERWAEDESERALTITLRGLGLSKRLCRAIREKYGDSAGEIVRERPYQLSDEVNGIGFVTADKLARTQGLPIDDPHRAKAALLYLIRGQEQQGHCYATADVLLRGASALEIPHDGARMALESLAAEARVVLREDSSGAGYIWRMPLWNGEKVVAEQLVRRCHSQLSFPFDEAEMARVEAAQHLTLDPSQRAALRLALQSQVAILTGGPGTGKTTLLRVLVRLLEQGEIRVELASPTGRASRRLAEATGRPASTLHRLLEARPDLGGFQRSATQPLELDYLIVDEVSMVDIPLMEAVLRALPAEARLLLVGDSEQLPSVGPGAVLRDLLRSEVVPVARLAKVHRQALTSGIISASRALLEGELPVSGEVGGASDFFLIHRAMPEKVITTLLEVVENRLPLRGITPDRVQVLSPTRKGPLGTDALNLRLQQLLNPDGEVVRRHGRALRVGDRVICTRNRYDVDVFNGDIGYLRSFAKNGAVVEFDGRLVEWAFEELLYLDLAYAITVHKSQGSEYPAALFILHSVHGIMLQRNLFYTAISRAAEFGCVIGDRTGWAKAVANRHRGQRNTTLVKRLKADAT
jgi:exodeoxyribonuclease V alpha subunit